MTLKSRLKALAKAQVDEYRSNMHSYLQMDIAALQNRLHSCPPSYVNGYKKEIAKEQKQLDLIILRRERAAEEAKVVVVEEVRKPQAVQLRRVPTQVLADAGD